MDTVAAPVVPPRLFWRRLGAFVVDLVLATAAAIILLLPFLGDTDTVRLGGSAKFSTTSCGPVDRLPQEVHDLVAPSRIESATVCREWFWGVPNGLTAKVVYGTQTGSYGTMHRWLLVPISESGVPVAPRYPTDALALPILILAGALLLPRSGATPGKRLFGLRVTGDLTPRRAALREVLRLLPLIVSALFSLEFPFASSFLGTLPFGTFLVLGVGVLAVVTWYWVWPLIFWNGALRHDRWLGLACARVNKR